MKDIFVTLPLAILKSLVLILSHRPKVVLGVGGYASIPVVMVASLLGTKTYIWEPNAFPGLANRLLSRFAKKALVVFEESKKYMKTKDVQVVGLPVRAAIESQPSIQRPEGFNILVFGGSLGARGINYVVARAILEGGDWLEGVNIVHQTGRLDFKDINEKYAQEGAKVECREYLNDMEVQYAKADLVISRAGAGTVAELAACRKPSLLIPFPGATDDHQKKNAENLQDAGAAMMCLQQEFTPEYLKSVVSMLKTHPTQLQRMAESVGQFHKPNAAQQIAELVYQAK